MAIYLYCRVSTDEQDPVVQERDLKKRFPEGIFVPEYGCGAKDKPVLNDLIYKLQKGDTLVVSAIDRLGRRATETLSLLEDLMARGVSFISLRENLDLATPLGVLIFQIAASFAEWERRIIIERTRAGLRKAKADGKKLGNKGKVIPSDVLAMMKSDRQNGMSYKKLSQKYKYSASFLCETFHKLDSSAQIS